MTRRRAGPWSTRKTFNLTSRKDKAAAVERLLGAGGVLASKWSGFELRQSQVEMAGQVMRAFENDDILMVEAGTGTGKTLAYLLPALLSGKKTVISTGTKNLQDQIFNKDIPFIQKYVSSGFRAALLKGRENYLCLRRFEQFSRDPVFFRPGEAVFSAKLADWAETTPTGDRAEIPGLPDDFATWSLLTADSEKCLGGKCSFFGDCFLQKARRRAAGADLVVVNHHLFMSDLAVRDAGHGEVIPAFEAVIFDEAHELEDIASRYFGRSASTYRVADLVKDATRVLTLSGAFDTHTVNLLAKINNHNDHLRDGVMTAPGEMELWREDSETMNRLTGALADLAISLRALATCLDQSARRLEGEMSEDLATLARRAAQMQDDIEFILAGSGQEYIFWAEKRKTGLFLKASPVQVGPLMREKLYGKGQTLVFTSATLTTDNNFEYFRERMGVFEEAPGWRLASPFDYQRQALLYVPATFPHPRAQAFLPRVVEEVEQLLELSQGRAFVLFTSYRALEYVSRRLEATLDWPVLIQGRAPKQALLEEFKARVDSVLFATYSFWQGVDVPGESLSAVIIDKLPFAPPDSPLLKARAERMRAQKMDPFMGLQVPQAIISLKQGLGRLIRTSGDRGLLAVLDSRLLNSSYGRVFLRSLPDYPLTRDPAGVARFFGEKR